MQRSSRSFSLREMQMKMTMSCHCIPVRKIMSRHGISPNTGNAKELGHSHIAGGKWRSTINHTEQFGSIFINLICNNTQHSNCTSWHSSQKQELCLCQQQHTNAYISFLIVTQICRHSRGTSVTEWFSKLWRLQMKYYLTSKKELALTHPIVGMNP